MPYYPEANSKVEKLNGLIVKNLTKLVQDKVRTWDSYLDNTLWACHVSFKSSTGFTISKFDLWARSITSYRT